MTVIPKCRAFGAAPPDPGPCTPVATVVQSPVHDAAGRVFYDAGSGEVLADANAWDRASEAARNRARARLAAVRHAEDLIATGVPRRVADRTAAAEAGVSAVAVGKWRYRVRGLPEGARVAALLGTTRGGRRSTMEPRACEILEALALHFGPHLTAAHAHRTLVARGCRAPSIRAVRRWLAHWRQENAHDLSAVTNPDKHRSHRKPAGGDAAANVERLNQVWELDSTLADVMCADGKRHAIVSAIDIWSRRARVLVVPTSRATAIAALLRRCMLEWGVPEMVRTDEGRDYTSHHVLGVLKNLELTHIPCPPYTPEAKPFVERFLGTLSRDLFANLPGFTGHDVAQAQALRARKSFAARRGEDAPKVFAVSLTAEELQAKCDSWCAVVYERRPHAGLDGASPFARAASWAEPVRRVHDERALDALLAEPAGGGWRTVGKKGIRLDNVDYIAGPLGPLVRERVRIRRDATDPDRIHVYRANGEFVCVAQDPARTGADRAAIAAQMKAGYSAHARNARQRARDLKRRHRPERSMNDVLAHAERKAGRVVALPRRGEAHETPALTQASRAAKAAAKADAAEEIATAPERPKVMAGVRWLIQEED